MALLVALMLAAPPQEGIPWVTDPSDGLQCAKNEGRAILMYFTADW